MQKIIHFIYDTCLGFLAKVVGGVMLLSVVIQIACRYLPMTPLRWTEELARLTFIWLCFIGAAMTLSKRKHLSINYFYEKIGKRPKHIWDVLTWVIVVFFSAVVTYYGIGLMGIVSIQKSPMLQIPMSYFYASVPFGGVMCAIYGLLSFIACVRGDNELTRLPD